MKRLLIIMMLLLPAFGLIQAQEMQVSGEIRDDSGDPLIGVSVFIKGTTTGTISNTDGQYRIRVANPNDTLIFSFVGMQEQVIPINARTTINVNMGQATSDLDEVVVVGYGTQTKASVVASISTVSADEITRSPTSNLTQGLAGKLPGLTILTRDGELGSENVQTFIRGQATTNNSSPLILVDGVEREISTLDPYDIESVSILKDASATAVFGVRGANGVILVTTKKGTIGKPQVTANVNYSMQAPTRLPKPLGAYDFTQVRNQVIEQHNEYTGQENPPQFSDLVVDYYQNGYDPDKHPSYFPEYWVDRDWYGEMLYDYVPMTKGNVNIRGGNERTKYFASAGYMSQGGPFKTERWDEYNYDNTQKLDRFTYRANIDMQVTNSLKAWLNLSGYLQDKNDPIIFGGNPSSATTASWYFLQMAALTDIPAISYPDVNSEGNIVSVPGFDRTPYGNMNRTGYRVTTNNNINSTLGLEQDLNFITDGLSARAIVSYDTRAVHIRGFRRTYATYIAQIDESGEEPVLRYTPGSGSESEIAPALTQSFRTNFDLEASLNYNRTFNNHAVTGLFLYKQNQEIVNVAVPFNYVGLVGRLTYAYDYKYLAEFNFGMNGSEQFAAGRRFGFFPSFSVGWVLSEESFMESAGFLDFFKIRASYGQVGNDRISNTRFIYLDDWTQGGGGYFAGMGGIPGLPNAVYQNSIPNELVSWEVANKYNIGLETSFLDGFEFDLDLFYELREDILITTSAIPVHMFGQLNLPPTNDGVMTNKGFETTLGYNKRVRPDWFLSARLSTSFARNIMEEMNETPLDDTYAYQYQMEGFSRGTVWGFDALGYFESRDEIDTWADQSSLGGTPKPGDLKYRDVNGDGEITDKDLIPMNNPVVPELNAALTLNTTFKGFDFSVLLHGVTNYGFSFSGRTIYDWEGNPYNGLKTYYEHHKYAWTAERAANGEEIRHPRMHIDGISVSKQQSNYWFLDLSYLRVKNLEFGYTIPKNLTSSIGIDRLRVYFNGMNILTFDNMPEKYLDPEVASSLSHPIFKTYNFGMNVTF